MTECDANEIYVLFLPAYYSHVLQPLDLTVFDSSKTKYVEGVNSRVPPSLSLTLGKRHSMD